MYFFVLPLLKTSLDVGAKFCAERGLQFCADLYQAASTTEAKKTEFEHQKKQIKTSKEMVAKNITSYNKMALIQNLSFTFYAITLLAIGIFHLHFFTLLLLTTIVYSSLNFRLTSLVNHPPLKGKA